MRNWRKDQPGPSSELVPNGGLVGGGVVVRRNNFDPRLCALDTTASPSQNQAIIAAFFFFLLRMMCSFCVFARLLPRCAVSSGVESGGVLSCTLDG